MSSFPLPFGFSSIGLPNSSLEEIFAVAQAAEADFVEIRVMGQGEELGTYIDARRTPPVPIRVIGTSLDLVDMGDREFELLRRLSDLADRCGAPWIRVFSGGSWTGELPDDSWFTRAAVAAERCQTIGEAFASKILLETHSALCSSNGCLRLLEKLAAPLPILWDSHHTWRLAGESIVESWSKLGPYVRHVHCKDSVTDSREQSGYRHVASGEGEFSLEELLEALTDGPYQGGLSLEWEKMWIPELPEFREVFPAFRRAIGR